MNNEGKITTNIYVATNGSDAWSGTLPEPNAAGTDGPFATLRRARDAVRAAVQAGQAAQAAWEAELRANTVELPAVWSFRRDPADTGEAAGWFAGEPDDAWTELRTDKTWTEQGHDYHGVAWYSVAFAVPAAKRAGRRYRLRFGAVDGCCRVWLDGREIGAQLRPPEEMFDKPFEFDVGGALASDRNHRLVVRVVKDRNAAGIWKPVRFEPVDEAAVPPAPITVLVRGGKYYLDATLVLGPEDSGTRECPVTWEAHPGETPVLSGGRVVAGWRAYKGNILCADVPEARGGWLRTRQLFCNGKRMSCARWPKLDPAEPLTSGWAFTEGAAGEHPATTFRYPAGTFRHRWAKPREVRVRAFMGHGWFMKDLPIKEIDEEARVISLAYDSWNPDIYPWYSPCVFTPANRFYIENALEELDQPGEWCLHGDDGMLYFWPPEGAGTDPEVVLPRLDCLIDIRGGSWITLAGFTFTETLDGDDFHPEGTHGTSSPGLRLGPRYGGTTVRLRGAAHCRIERNHFRDVGGNALYIEDENERNLVSRNEFSGAGFAAVCLAGSPTQQPRHNEVSDNYIHHCGVINKYVAGVFLGMSDGNRVCHNRIEYLPHHAINLSDNPKGRNYIEYNDMRWVCQEISDNGAINCWMEQPYGDTERCGHVIRFNYIADIYGLENVNGKLVRSRNFPVSGIYLDSVTSNCLVYGNVIVRVGMLGIVVQNGKNNLIENNVIVDCPIGIRFQDAILWYKAFARYAGIMAGNVLHRNIYSRTQPGSIPIAFSVPLEVVGGEERIVAFCDENLYHGVPGNACRVMQRSWRDDGRNRDYTGEEWQRLGFDQGSLIADPLFVDPAKGDYRLRPESPALKLGFVPIPVEKIGIRKE